MGDLKVGDLITVLLLESTQATRGTNVETNRASTNDVLGVGAAAGSLNLSARGQNFSRAENKRSHYH